MFDVLLRFVSRLNAESALERAARDLGLSLDRLKPSDVPRLAPALERRIRLFIDHDQHRRLAKELASAMGDETPPTRTCRIEVNHEDDVHRARAAAKSLCDGTGARSFAAHKVVTIVSELGRNILQYTPGGSLELTCTTSRSSARVSILAVDRGAGIPDLAHVMSGAYKSKTGMGRGLIGVKRLADAFTIDPGPPGVRVHAEVAL
jgi:serine/threonine-protein kinase RsbT